MFKKILLLPAALLAFFVFSSSYAYAQTAIQAKRAYDFSSTIGLNIHSNYYDTVYNNSSQWLPLLYASGVKHVRTNFRSNNDPANNAIIEDIAAHGIKVLITSDWIINSGVNPVDVVNYIAANPPLAAAISQIAGPNEINLTQANWQTTVPAFMKSLYAAVKGNAATAHIQVTTPNFAGDDSSMRTTLGDLSASVDLGDNHNTPNDYQGQQSDTDSWQQHIMDVTSIMAPGKTQLNTEFGYSTGTSTSHTVGTPAPQVTDMILHDYLDAFRFGVLSSDDYQLLEQGGPVGSWEAGLGIVDPNYNPLPQYTALQAFTSLIADPAGSSFSPATLGYTLNGASTSTRSVLLQKSDGSFWLAIYEQANVWNPVTQTVLAVPTVPITLQLSQLASGKVYVPETNGTTSISTFSNTASVPILSGAPITWVQIVNVPNAPSATLTANPTSLFSGQSSTLTWSSTNATSCASINFPTGGATSGSTSVSPTITTTYSITCSSSQGSATSTATITVTIPPSSSPIAYWKFDEGSGTSAFDSSGNGNTGTLVNGPVWTTGKIGGAIQTDGASNYVEVQDSSTTNATGDFTVAAWVKSTQGMAANQWPMIVFKQPGSGTRQGYEITLHDSTNDSRWAGGIWVNNNPYGAYGASNIADGTWHHLAFERQGSMLSTYQDGVLANTASSPNTTLSNTAPLHFGRSNFAPQYAYYFGGAIDDARFYNRALSASEISALVTAGGGTTTPPDTTSPSIPTNLTASAVSISQINLAWNASTDPDNTASQIAYNVYRNGTKITSVTATSYSDTGLSANTAYSYAVSAYDPAGNVSAQSPSVSATTNAASFSIGARVKTTASVNVRNRPSTRRSSILCTQPAGSLGTIGNGPQYNNGYTWWYVKFDTSCAGWVTQNYLTTSIALVQPQTMIAASSDVKSTIASLRLEIANLLAEVTNLQARLAAAVGTIR